MSEQIKVTSRLPDGREVEFESRQDALLFAANTGNFAAFVNIYRQVYQTATGAGRLYTELRSPDNRKKAFQIARDTKLSDGTSLFDALRSMK